MYERMNNEMFIRRVINTTDCSNHVKMHGEPCYRIDSSTTNRSYLGVCDRRARLAGFNGVISPESMSRTSQQRATRRDRV